MNRVVAVTCRVLSLLLLASLLAPVSLFAGDDLPPLPPANPGILPLDQVRPGMRGVAYTVFQGANPEPMEVEVLGVLKNINGPKGDVILIRLHGAKAEYTGVVAGMSGSPVYLEGKLAGALAFRIGEFSKEPIAGVTPIEDMLEINALDSSQPPAAQPVSTTSAAGARKTAAPGEPVALSGGLQDYANYLRPIEAPLVFSGFSEEALRYFGPQFAAAGVVPVMGTGSVTSEKQPEPIIPGSSVSAVLIASRRAVAVSALRGSQDRTATGTGSAMVAGRITAPLHRMARCNGRRTDLAEGYPDPCDHGVSGSCRSARHGSHDKH